MHAHNSEVLHTYDAHSLNVLFTIRMQPIMHGSTHNHKVPWFSSVCLVLIELGDYYAVIGTLIRHVSGVRFEVVLMIQGSNRFFP